MKVTLASITPNPLEMIYKGYRVCYSKVPQENIKIPVIKNGLDVCPDNSAMKDFIVPLIAKGHESPLEHVVMTFYIEGVSRALMGQITRHRTASFSIQSQRYVDADNFNYILPTSVIEHESSATYIEVMNHCKKAYRQMVEAGVPQEDARMVLPEATTTNITMTIDLRNFRHFYALRSCKQAQWEIRKLALDMGELVSTVLPTSIATKRNCSTCKDAEKCFK